METYIEIITHDGRVVDRQDLSYNKWSLSSYHQGNFSITPMGKETSLHETIPFDVRNIQNNKLKGKETIKKIKFFGFDTLFLSVHASYELEITKVRHLHFLVDGFDANFSAVDNFYFHSTLTKETALPLPRDVHVHLIDPVHFEAKHRHLRSIIGQGSTLQILTAEAVADYVCLDNYHFPDPKDWRINIRSIKFLHISRVLNIYYATLWNNFKLSDAKRSSDILKVYNDKHSDLRSILDHLKEFGYAENIELTPIDFLSSVEASLVAANQFRRASLVNSARQNYELMHLSYPQKFDPKYIIQFCSGLLSGFQNSILRPAIFLVSAVFLLYFAVFINQNHLLVGCLKDSAIRALCMSHDYLCAHCFARTIKLIYRPWEEDSLGLIIFGATMPFFVAIQFYMIKHAYNRHSYYKW